MIEFVCGFAFRDDLKKVILIKKLKPTWQNGLLNGVGGKIEEGEGKLDAMVREFKEETGSHTLRVQWDYFCRTESLQSRSVVHYYSCISDRVYGSAKTTEKEEIVRVWLSQLLDYPRVSNLDWLIPMSLDTDVFFCNVRI